MLPDSSSEWFYFNYSLSLHFLSIFLIPIARVLFALVCNLALLRKEFRPGTDILAVPRAGIHTAVTPEEPPVYWNGIFLLEQIHSVIAPMLTEGVAVCNMSLQTAGLLLFNLLLDMPLFNCEI